MNAKVGFKAAIFKRVLNKKDLVGATESSVIMTSKNVTAPRDSRKLSSKFISVAKRPLVILVKKCVLPPLEFFRAYFFESIQRQLANDLVIEQRRQFEALKNEQFELSRRISDRLDALDSQVNSESRSVSGDMTEVRETVAQSKLNVLSRLDEISGEIGSLRKDMGKTILEEGASLQRIIEVSADKSNQVFQELNALNTVLERIVPEVRNSIQKELRAAESKYERAIRSIEEKIESNEKDIADTITRSDGEKIHNLLELIRDYAYISVRRFSTSLKDGNLLLRTELGYLVVPSDDPALISALIENGELELGTRKLITSLLNDGDVFVDLGANIGLITIPAAKSVLPTGKVYSLEPAKQNVTCLQQNIHIHGLEDAVNLIPVAAGEKKAKVNLYHGKSCGHHSLYPLGNLASGATEEVSVEKLDSILGQGMEVALIKIDVEGAELEALKGAERILQSNEDIKLIVEFSPIHLKRTNKSDTEWFDYFESMGFSYRAISPEKGELVEVSRDELLDSYSTNLFFSRKFD